MMDSMLGKPSFCGFLPLALLVCWPGAAFGMNLGQGGDGSQGSLLLLQALSPCVTLSEINGRGTLINRCGACQAVGLSHKRPGDKPAIHRTYPVPANSSTGLPFRGPGQSQITSIAPCRPEATQDQKKDATASEKCAHLQRTLDGGLVIINTCNGCLEAEAELLGEGNFKARESFTLAGRAYMPVETKGASQARILSERKCR